MKLNQRGITNIILALLVGAAITVVAFLAAQNYTRHSTHRAESTATPTPASSDQKAVIATMKAVIKLWEDNSADGSSAEPALKSSQYVTPKLVKYLNDVYDKSKSELDPVECKIAGGFAPRTYQVINIDGTSSRAITKQSDGGETAVDLVKVNGQWKIDALNCVPLSAQ